MAQQIDHVPVITPRPPPTAPARLPYSERFIRLTDPVRRTFRVGNRAIVPALNAGLGVVISNPLTGHLFVLRMRGRRTGRSRQVPLGYVIIDGDIYCVAGWGRRTNWLANIAADPRVEAVLPGRTVRGVATVVTDPIEWARAYRRLIRSFGLLGRSVLGDVSRLDDRELFAQHGALPVVRIHPTGVVPGAFDPGGRGWLAILAIEIELALLGGWLWRRRRLQRR
jgi:deazaflavin-dependent oxidoreductase (nitroreductase family)